MAQGNKAASPLNVIRDNLPSIFHLLGSLKHIQTASSEQAAVGAGPGTEEAVCKTIPQLPSQLSPKDGACDEFSESRCTLSLPQLDAFEARITFSKQQLQVLDAISQGKSVFVTGAAGTGKTLLLTHAVELLRTLHGDEFVFVTASTGIAACNLGGTTLHSFAGIKLGIESKEQLARAVWCHKGLRNNWLKAKALVIDEISMIDSRTFEKLEYVGRMVRAAVHEGEVRVFGGLQLLVAGDFFQLPPVLHKSFAFEANCWEECFDLEMNLSHVFRQSDMEFVTILNELRVGHCSSESIQTLLSCERPLPDDGSGISATKLYPLKFETRRENEQKLMTLGEEILTFVAEDEAVTDHAPSMFKKMIAEERLPLCVGAQVILVKNLLAEAGLVNGARGVVVDFAPSQDAVAERFANTISPNQLWPVVRFACDGRERVVGPQLWKYQVSGKVLGKRWQVPLILAWALSVHKCQGMTLDRVETHLSEVFDYGMAYVALSRVKSLEGLHLVGFDPSKVKAHPKVFEYYSKFSNMDF